MKTLPAFCFDSLESRTMLSASLFVRHGTVAAFGDSAVANTITVALAPDDPANPTVHKVMVTVAPEGGTALTQTFDLAHVKKIVLEGGKLNDTITVDEGLDAARQRLTIIAGHAGNDVITTGGEKDLVLGGEGDDLISTGDGRDTVLAGAGNDTVDAGAGADLIFGGAGDDSVSTGEGKDTVFGLAGHDVIHLGGGGDVANLGGHDELFGGAGDDTFYVAKNGQDSVTGGAGGDRTREVKGKTLHNRLKAAVNSVHLDKRLRIEV